MTSSPTSFFSSSTSSSSSFVVTREMFNCFHKIDRTLFSHLIFSLNRDINQSYQVMAFLLLIEQTVHSGDLIAYLVSLPDAFIDAVANEVGVCLSFLNSQEFASTFFAAKNNDDNSIIPLLLRLTKGKLTLSVIQQNRENFGVRMTKIMNETCSRAFEDIIPRAERYKKEKLMAMEREILAEEMRRLGIVQQETTTSLNVQQETIPPPPPPSPLVEEETKKEHMEVAMAADDRTVFLTFSKGYPISEEEVRLYFTWRFGDVIEAIEMQEVDDYEQPLFAKMVLKMRCASKMEEIVNIRSRNKYTINGKHVWARKYIRRNPHYPASSATPI